MLCRCDSKAKGRDEDALGFRRDEPPLPMVLLVEQPNGGFCHDMMRQLLYAAVTCIRSSKRLSGLAMRA